MIRGLRFAAVPALLLAGCVAGSPCYTERQQMYPDQSSSCLAGRVYQCDNGDWIAARKSCPMPAQVATGIAATCEYAGVSFSNGSASCNAGTQYRCDNGRWTSLGTVCAADAPLPVAPYGAACSYNGSTIASNSAICQSGTTFLCNNGAWMNLGTGCR